MIRIEHNVETGVITEVELTAKEIKEQENLQAAIEAKEAKALADSIAKTALLERLGITAEEAALLLK
jgi:hypothetical protein